MGKEEGVGKFKNFEDVIYMEALKGGGGGGLLSVVVVIACSFSPRSRNSASLKRRLESGG